MKSKLWFGTSDGLFSFDRERLNRSMENYKPGVFLSGFQVNFNDVDEKKMDENLELQYNENRLRFVFQVLALYQPEQVVLEYRLDTESEWLRSGSSNDIVFDQLAPGTYQLEVRASLNDIYSDILEFNFVILQPFYARWWFILIVVFALGLIAAFIVNYRIQQIRNQETQEKLILNNRLNVLEQQSLNASMNRHFIFNSLNSIQYFINTQDRLSANKFLSKFAQLIRKNLDSSAAGESKVSLSEEIERLKLYMSLEAMRFEGRFEYEFDIDDEISSEEIMIPAMLFQPFMENAIIHGVLPNEKQVGKIVFRAYLEGEQLVFKITDNGVGYTTSLKEKKGNGDHFSHGTNITRSRIDVIRKISGEIISLHGPQDIRSETGLIVGTEVIIRFNVV
jgi:sensor histidine kinase YesM